MGNYRNFMLVYYFVAQGTAHATREKLEEDIRFFEKYMRPDKVYLEPYRSSVFADEKQVELCREVFRAHGVEVAGGLTTTVRTPAGEEEKQRIFETCCYNDEKMVAELRNACRFIGQHYDEFIIDDFFFTNCTCDACRKGRDEYNRAHGITDGSWKAYRLALMEKVSREDIIAPAKEANPNCRVTIKYPNWAESYQETGYNPAGQRKLFDRIYTGTEARDTVTTDQHLPRYLSYSLVTYFENMWPGHNGGGWFDPFDLHITEQYLEQAFLTAFAKAKELMMFCFQALVDHPFIPALGFHLDKLDEVLDHCGTPVGIACYLPDNCQGEDNLQDFLGMVGLPITLTPYFPMKERQILLTRSAACDPDIADKLDGYLQQGDRRALVTAGFWDAIRGRGERFTSIRLRGRTVTADRYRVEAKTASGQAYCTFPEGVRPITLPVAEFRNNATWAVVKAVSGEESYGILLRDHYAQSELWTLTAPDAYPELYRIPAPALSRIREAFPVQGMWLEGPARISLFPYDNDTVILYYYVMDGTQPEEVYLHVRGAKALMSLPGGKRPTEPLWTKDGEAVFRLPIRPGDYLMYKIIKDE